MATASALSSSDQEVIVLDENPLEDPVFLALKGYSLYNQKEKQNAIVEFLSLSSFSVIFISGNDTINSCVEDLYTTPKLVLNGYLEKGGKKLPAKWTAKYCAEFILDCVKLIEDDRELCQSSVTRKRSSRRSVQSSLPPAAARLV